MHRNNHHILPCATLYPCQFLFRVPVLRLVEHCSDTGLRGSLILQPCDIFRWEARSSTGMAGSSLFSLAEYIRVRSSLPLAPTGRSLELLVQDRLPAVFILRALVGHPESAGVQCLAKRAYPERGLVRQDFGRPKPRKLLYRWQLKQASSRRASVSQFCMRCFGCTKRR